MQNTNRAQWGSSDYAEGQNPQSTHPRGTITFYNPHDFSVKQQSQYQHHEENWFSNSVPNVNQRNMLAPSADPWNWPSDDSNDNQTNVQQPHVWNTGKNATQGIQEYSNKHWEHKEQELSQQPAIPHTIQSQQTSWPAASYDAYHQPAVSQTSTFPVSQNQEQQFWGHQGAIQQQPIHNEWNYGGSEQSYSNLQTWQDTSYNMPYQHHHQQQQWTGQEHSMNSETAVHYQEQEHCASDFTNQGLQSLEEADKSKLHSQSTEHLNNSDRSGTQGSEHLAEGSTYTNLEASSPNLLNSKVPVSSTNYYVLPSDESSRSIDQQNANSELHARNVQYGSQEQIQLPASHNYPSEDLENKLGYEQHELNNSGAFAPFFGNDVYDKDADASSVSQHKSQEEECAEVTNGQAKEEEKSTTNSEVVHSNLSTSAGSLQDWEDSSVVQPMASGLEDGVNREVPESPTVSEVIPTLKKLSVSALPTARVSGDGEQLDEPSSSMRSAGAGMESVGETANQQTPNDVHQGVGVPVVQQDRIQNVRIRHREGSPFKPLVKNNVKGVHQSHGSCIVQQEVLNDVESSAPINCSESGRHDANLETEPDNLERPPDIELVNSQPPCLSAAHHRHHQREQYNSTPSAALWESPELPNITLVPASPAALNSQLHNEPGKVEKAESNGKVENDNGPPSRQSPLGGEGAQVDSGKTWQVPVSLVQVPKHDPKQRENENEINPPLSISDSSVPSATAMDLIHRTSPLGEGQVQAPPPLRTSLSKDSLTMSVPSDISKSGSLEKSLGLVQPSVGVAYSTQPVRSSDSVNKQSNYPGERTGKIAPTSMRRNSHDGIGGVRMQRSDNRLKSEALPDTAILKNAASSDNVGIIEEQHLQPDFSRSSKGYYRGEDRRDEQRRPREYNDQGSPRSMAASREDLHDDRSRRRDYGHPWEERKYRSFDDRDALYERERSRPPSRSSVTDSYNEYSRQIPEQGYDPTQQVDHYRRGSRDGDRPDRRDYGQYERHGYPDRYAGYSRMDEYYQNAGQYRGYDYGYYRRERSPFYQQYTTDPYRYAYGTYNYGYHDELYRTDPRYREQMEQYRAYYARLGYDNASYGHASVHSGRSSVNELERDTASYGQEYDQSSLSTRDYPSYSHDLRQDTTSYSDGFSDSVKLDSDQISITSPSRLTPLQFSRPHTIARLTHKGHLIKVLPHLPSLGQVVTVEIHDIQKILSLDPVFTELSEFPGPLIRHETHKNDVIHFCQQKVKAAQDAVDVPDRASIILLWELLILLLRQNGSVAGTDIAELLLKDHEILKPPLPEPAEFPSGDVGSNASPESTSPDEGIVITQDSTNINVSYTKEHLTCRFREYLLFGRKKDALEWAMKNDLWGHALFLASKMDTRTYSNVMARFANSLTLQDPLQTLYQLMSGRQPTAVTHVADEKWGDWRPHLAMILSNPSRRHELDQKSITALGDTLAGRGLLHAAHFCYLMAELEFGLYEQKACKLVLLGSNHRLPFQQFATNEAIQCTEIYEYARSLAEPTYVLPQFQMYKLIYAARLIDYGFPQEALHYCEIISNKFHDKVGFYSLDLISQVYELSCKLKYFDPHYSQGEGETEELSDPLWLTNLQNLRQQTQDGTVFAPSNDGYSGLTSYSTENDADTSTYTVGGGTDYSQTDYGQTVQPDAQHQQPQYATGGEQQHNTFSSSQNFSQMGNDYNYSWNSYDQQNAQQSTEQIHSEPNLSQWNTTPSAQSAGTPDYSSIGNSSSPQQTTEHQQSSFDYYGASTKQENQLSKTSRQYSWEHSDGTTNQGPESRRGSVVSYGSSSTDQRRESISKSSSISKPDERKRVVKKDENKTNQQTSRSWLGGIFSRLMPKAPNQMILPDDKNPSIVWDPVKCKWVNKDGEDDENDEKNAAPPKDSELNSSDRLTMPPTGLPAGNKFQRVKTRGMRQNYVDILNPGTGQASQPAPQSSLPPNLFPSLDTNISNSANFLIPQPESQSVSESNLSNVNYIPSGQHYGNSSEPNNNEETASKVQPLANENTTPAVPMMFNPAQFATNAGPAHPASKPSRFQRMPYKT